MIRHYTELWCKNEEYENTYSNDTSEVEEVDDITIEELQNTLSEMKNGRTAGTDRLIQTELNT